MGAIIIKIILKQKEALRLLLSTFTVLALSHTAMAQGAFPEGKSLEARRAWLETYVGTTFTDQLSGQQIKLNRIFSVGASGGIYTVKDKFGNKSLFKVIPANTLGSKNSFFKPRRSKNKSSSTLSRLQKLANSSPLMINLNKTYYGNLMGNPHNFVGINMDLHKPQEHKNKNRVHPFDLMIHSHLTNEVVQTRANEILKVFYHGLISIVEMYNYNFLHLDYKPANILETKDGYLLADLDGVSTPKILNSWTEDYSSPEIIERQKFENKKGLMSALFALGHSIYHLTHGELLWPADISDSRFTRVLDASGKAVTPAKLRAELNADMYNQNEIPKMYESNQAALKIIKANAPNELYKEFKNMLEITDAFSQYSYSDRVLELKRALTELGYSKTMPKNIPTEIKAQDKMVLEGIRSFTLAIEKHRSINAFHTLPPRVQRAMSCKMALD